MSSKSNKKVTKLNSLAELSNYSDSLVQVSEPLISTEPISGYNDNLNENVYTVKIPEQNIKSFNCKDYHFTNKIANLSPSCRINSELIEILKLNNQRLNEKDMPMKFNGTLKIKDRIKDIFCYKSFALDKVVFKWYYTGKTMNGIHFKMNKQTLRIYLILDSKTKEMTIILLDPHHLLATENYEKGYEQVKGNGSCITSLKKYV